MRRCSMLLTLVAATAALVLPAGTAAAATTTVTYDLTGTASPSLFPQVSFSGSAASTSASTKEKGVWAAAFSQDLGAILPDPDATFSFTSKLRSFSDTIVGGTFGSGFGFPPGTCAKTEIPVHGVLGGGGSFDVTLTRYGSLKTGSCVVTRSTVRGTATLVFPA